MLKRQITRSHVFNTLKFDKKFCTTNVKNNNKLNNIKIITNNKQTFDDYKKKVCYTLFTTNDDIVLKRTSCGAMIGLLTGSIFGGLEGNPILMILMGLLGTVVGGVVIGIPVITLSIGGIIITSLGVGHVVKKLFC